MLTIEPVADPDEPVGTLRWTSWTGHEYLHRPPEAAVAPLRPDERLTDSWSRSLAEVRVEEARQGARASSDRGGDPVDDLPPF
jgi:hypothetical protein